MPLFPTSVPTLEHHIEIRGLRRREQGLDKWVQKRWTTDAKPEMKEQQQDLGFHAERELQLHCYICTCQQLSAFGKLTLPPLPTTDR